MRRTTISFETKLLRSCVKLTKEIDVQCFPKEMWLGGAELESLLQHNAEATILTYDGIVIGQAITLTEDAASKILEEADAEFRVHPGGVYSYSEAIIPSHQNLGYGALLLHEVSLRMKQRGFISISAHVRTRHGWNMRREKTLSVTEARMLYDFWDDKREVVQYQRAYL